jgi:hypothetical protein
LISVCQRTKQELAFLHQQHADDVAQMRQLCAALERSKHQTGDLVTQLNALIEHAGMEAHRSSIPNDWCSESLLWCGIDWCVCVCVAADSEKKRADSNERAALALQQQLQTVSAQLEGAKVLALMHQHGYWRLLHVLVCTDT